MANERKKAVLGHLVMTLVGLPTKTLGTILDLVNKIRDDEGFLDDLKGLLAGRREVCAKKILKWIGTTTTSATTEKFVAKEKFRKDSKGVKFYGFYGSFKEDFLVGNGKIEEPLDQQELRYGNITNNSVDGLIIKELGGKAKAETTLTELYDLLKKQANDEKGGLLSNGLANIFYIKNVSGVLRAVRVYWGDVGWYVFARSVGYSVAWPVGRRVFSRNS